MRLIVGLGNPGRKYQGTRHNVGFDVVSEVATRHSLEFESAPTEAVIAKTRGVDPGLLVVKPLTFMNRSGLAVAALVRYYRITLDDVLIVAEDVELPLGRLRARASGGDGGHNGLVSIIDALGTEGFSRLRVGVGRGDVRRDLAAHVLSRFETSEETAIRDSIARAADAVDAFVGNDIGYVMNRFNGPEPESSVADKENSEHS